MSVHFVFPGASTVFEATLKGKHTHHTLIGLKSLAHLNLHLAAAASGWFYWLVWDRRFKAAITPQSV